MAACEGFILLVNIASTVGIVFANKYVMSAFPFSMAITVIHQVVASLLIVVRAGALRPQKPLPLLTDIWIGLITVGSIYFCNQSLRINSVTLYQIAKLLNVPTMCLFLYVGKGKTYSFSVYFSLFIITVGVGIATIAEFSVSPSVIGLVMAALGVLVTVIDQFEIGRLKEKYQSDSVDFIHSNLFHRIAVGSSIVALFEQEAVSSALDMSLVCGIALLATCLLATAINLSSVAIIGKFGPLTMTVTGHVKTMTIMILGFLWNPPELDALLLKKLFGIVLALCAAIKYGQLTAFPDSSISGGCLALLGCAQDAGDLENSTAEQASKLQDLRWLWMKRTLVTALIALLLALGTFTSRYVQEW
jgi:solute carrier family 35 protein E3